MTDLTCVDKTMSMYIAMEGAVMVDLYCLFISRT